MIATLVAMGVGGIGYPSAAPVLLHRPLSAEQNPLDPRQIASRVMLSPNVETRGECYTTSHHAQVLERIKSLD